MPREWVLWLEASVEEPRALAMPSDGVCTSTGSTTGCVTRDRAACAAA